MISALIITKNEESNILRCIKSLVDVADEIIVLDSGSTDQTTTIAESVGAKVIQTEWKGYAQTKNEGHSLCQYDYILSLDADEELSPELAGNIRQLKAKGLDGAYKLDRHNYYLGKWIRSCGWYPDWKTRLFDKNTAHWRGEYVHEELVVNAGVTVHKIDGAFNHYSIHSIEQHRRTIEKYARLAADKRKKSGKKGNVLTGILKFLTTFLRIYLIKFGFIEGKRGLYIAYYSGLSKWLRYKS